MARKFLYFIAVIAVLVIAAGFILNIYAKEISQLAFVPSAEFEEQEALTENAYADPAMWYSRPGMGTNDPARWQPATRGEGRTIPTPADQSPPDFAVFFVHPTSYLEKTTWNAPLDDAASQERARLFIRGLASPFNQASEIWAPRYRQATVGAFLTDAPEAQQALDAAYADVAQSFEYFVSSIDADMPIVLAGHSQGSLHLLKLLQDKVANSALSGRIAAVYAVGWPISVEHDLPALGLPACATANQTGCILSWSSFAEPADPSAVMDVYNGSVGLDGEMRTDSMILCTNPLTGRVGGTAPATQNLGTLVPEDDLSNGELVPSAVPARCDERGLLLIGDPPELGAAVLPGNNYHVYDIPLFWRNVQADVGQRVSALAAPAE